MFHFAMTVISLNRFKVTGINYIECLCGVTKKSSKPLFYTTMLSRACRGAGHCRGGGHRGHRGHREGGDVGGGLEEGGGGGREEGGGGGGLEVGGRGGGQAGGGGGGQAGQGGGAGGGGQVW